MGGGGGGGAATPCSGSGCIGGGGGGGSSLVPAGGSFAINSTTDPVIVISTEPLPTISFTSGPPAQAFKGVPYRFVYTAAGDADIQFFAPPVGYLPLGLSLSRDGVLDGTPLVSSSHTFPVTAIGASGARVTREDTIQVVEQLPELVPIVTLAPASIDFGGRRVWTTSATAPVTMTNSGSAPLALASIAIEGPDSSDFAIAADGCPRALAPSASCNVHVTFTPTAAGPRSATLAFVDDADGSPHQVALSGVGQQPVASVAPITVDFGGQTVETTSSARVVTLSNTGDASLFVNSASITGPAAGDFAMISDQCTTAGILPAGASCTVSVAFTPSVPGLRTAMFQFGDDAGGSPHSVALTGMGAAASADLAVSIAATPNPAKAGSKVTYTISILNAGPSGALNVQLNDVLSSQSTFVSAKPSQGTCVTPVKGASGTLSCSIGSVASAAHSTTEIVVTVIAKKTSITNTVTVSSTTSDPNLVNNTASITTRVK
jgi:uncharacterized repeat protein (TIGR01451 family)